MLGESDRERNRHGHSRNAHDKMMETPLDWEVKLRKEEADSCDSADQALSEEGR